MIKLYQWEISPFCDKVRRVLALKGQPYVVEELALSDTLTGKLRRLNRRTKVPTLEHDGRIFVDSSDIARHLDREFPEPPLFPESTRERALVAVLEDWADESLYFYEMYLRFGVAANARRWVPVLAQHDSPAMQRLARVVVPLHTRQTTHAQGIGRKPLEVVVREVGEHVGAIDELLGDGAWLVGERVSLADIAVFVQLFAIRGAPEGAAAVEARPRVVDWMDRVDAATR